MKQKHPIKPIHSSKDKEQLSKIFSERLSNTSRSDTATSHFSLLISNFTLLLAFYMIICYNIRKSI